MITIGYAKPVNYTQLTTWGYYPSGRVHRAIDYPCPTGSRVQSGYAGVVTTAGWSTTGFGNHVRVRYDDGNTAIYAHLSRISVRVGQRVAKRQLIGYSGSTGNSTGPHTHWEIRRSSWDPSTSWNYSSKIESYAARSIDPAPAPSTTGLAYSGYSFNRRLLVPGAKNEEVRKFQYWLWQRQPLAYRTWFKANVYDFDKYLPTALYGPATTRLVQDTYKRLNTQYPSGGWASGVVNGVWPDTPGPGLFKHFGNTSYWR